MGATNVVYILRSERRPSRYYTGVTSELARRIESHNAGQNVSTAADRPWRLHVSFHFDSDDVATRFEKYLKSGSGREFARRHFESP